MLAGSCIWSAVNKYQNGMAKVAKKAFNAGNVVTELLSSYWRAHLVESYCNVSNIFDTNWLRNLFSSYLNKIWLSIWRHHLTNFHILKTSISLERKEIFENNKQHFSAHEVYLFMFQNGLDRKDAIFVIEVGSSIRARYLVTSIRRLASSTPRFTSSTHHWPHRFVVVCRYAVSLWHFIVSMLRFTDSTRPLNEAIIRLPLHEVSLDFGRWYHRKPKLSGHRQHDIA